MKKNGGIIIDWANNRGFATIIMLALATILIILFSYFRFMKKEAPTPVVDDQPKTFADLVQVVDPKEIPGDLPKDLPIEKDVHLVKNEMVYFANRGEIHAVRSYYTDRLAKDVFDEFAQYFNTNKWQPLSVLDQENVKFLLSRKDGINGVVQVNISKNQIDGRVLVEIVHITKNSNSNQ